jgi:hypothetical protein
MASELKKIYFMLVIPAVAALLAAYAGRRLGLIPLQLNISITVIAPILFVFSVLFAIALPVFLRSLFAHRVRHQQRVSQAELIKFERKLLFVSLLTPYFILPAYLLDLPGFFFSATVLMALYAAYYFYPSRKRIQFEKRIFRVD